MAKESSDEHHDALRAELRAQAAGALRSEGSGIEQIHDTRVAIRRLRSTLRVFEPLLTDAGEARETDEELRWLAGVYGAVRDRQVQRARFAAEQLETGFLEKKLYDEQVVCESALRDALQGERFGALRERLEAWATRPPVRKASTASLEDCARAAARQAKRRLRAAHDDADLHRARKSAKRARYAAELVRRQRRADRLRRMQDLLGELQDTVVAGETLQRFLAEASREEAFVLGALYGHELDERERLRREARALT